MSVRFSLTPDQSTAPFKATFEMSKGSHFSRYCSSPTVHQVLKTETFAPELIFDTMVIIVSVALTGQR